ncbi:S-adenosylmethionine decarboxylase proenzyme [Thrips palmi]|uniref:S-adenosylmethionine decarboxylase proenzyme n=1 Tax=Thrips palmi TaxID=161013 RepID=A0A6P8Z2D4_THRPL|nr:S-adenosylmethionine decarboxylase proenzyme [Thrips palmi]
MAESEPKFSGAEYFEGVEKLLEIWFTHTDGKAKNCDLRSIPRNKWESLLQIVHCEVISFSSNELVDAYVLSESSMFISKNRFILKTCGTTTPLQCLEPLIMLVNQHAGFNSYEDVFYSRKNFKRPDLQKSPHRTFDEEVELLNAIFKDGSSYCLGEEDSECWYLYTLHPNNVPQLAQPDQTLEILMSDLDPKVMSLFTKASSSSALEATKKSGIDKLIPNMRIDDFLFDPCGYSMNGITKSGYYMTIHITPELEFSYVSFETNIPQSSYKDVISRVIETFKPGKFVVTIFANKASPASASTHEMQKLSRFGPWMQRDIQFCRLNNYDLTYTFYSKFPS